MVIEREGDRDTGALHDGKAGGIDGRQLVHIRAPEVSPGLLQVAQLAAKDLDRAGFIDRFLPRQCYVPIGVALEEGERLDDDGD